MTDTHRLFITHPRMPLNEIVERECRIVVTAKVTWAEPLMPLRGTARSQRRFMIGAYAFYTRQQAERRKIMQLLALMKARKHPALVDEARQQIEMYKATGVVR